MDRYADMLQYVLPIAAAGMGALGQRGRGIAGGLLGGIGVANQLRRNQILEQENQRAIQDRATWQGSLQPGGSLVSPRYKDLQISMPEEEPSMIQAESPAARADVMPRAPIVDERYADILRALPPSAGMQLLSEREKERQPKYIGGKETGYYRVGETGKGEQVVPGEPKPKKERYQDVLPIAQSFEPGVGTEAEFEFEGGKIKRQGQLQPQREQVPHESQITLRAAQEAAARAAAGASGASAALSGVRAGTERTQQEVNRARADQLKRGGQETYTESITESAPANPVDVEIIAENIAADALRNNASTPEDFKAIAAQYGYDIVGGNPTVSNPWFGKPKLQGNFTLKKKATMRTTTRTPRTSTPNRIMFDAEGNQVTQQPEDY